VREPLERLLPYLGEDKMVVSFRAVADFQRVAQFEPLLLSMIKADRAREARQLTGAGYVNQRLYLDREVVGIERRGIFVCPKGPLSSLGGVKVWRHHPTEEALCKAASYALSYSPWFLQGLPQDVVVVMKGLGKTRLLVGYGLQADTESDE
jgi:hypothetical protein